MSDGRIATVVNNTDLQVTHGVTLKGVGAAALLYTGLAFPGPGTFVLQGEELLSHVSSNHPDAATVLGNLFGAVIGRTEHITENGAVIIPPGKIESLDTLPADVVNPFFPMRQFDAFVDLPPVWLADP